MRILPPALLLAPILLLSSAASAQVLVTEVQPNPLSAGDTEEWVELHNVGTASVALDGWTINDFVGTTVPTMESATLWTFPPATEIGPGQVLVIARQAAEFNNSLGVIASWELADGDDDVNVPNLLPVGGTDPIQLSNSAAGDAVVLRDDQGTVVSYAEWGTLDRSVAGSPFSSSPPSTASLIRVNVTGNSATDFIIANTPTPFVGFMSSGPPMITGTIISPRHAVFGDNYRVSTTVMDADGINAVEIFFASATSSTGPAAGNYLGTTLTATGTLYSFESPIEDLGAGFAEPASFHDRYIRFFISAQDGNQEIGTEPANADEGAANENYLPAYVQNVLPTAPTAISDAREAAAEDVPAWTGHSVRVQGIALAEPNLMDPARTLFPIQDGSNAAIVYFATSSIAPAFVAGDELVLTGVIGSFLGSTQLSDGEIELTGVSGTVPETNLTLAQIIADGEQYEGQLIKIDDVDFVDARADWPSDPNDLGSWNVPVTDGTNELTLRVTSAADIFGQPAPQYGFDIRGILNERNGAWQLFPRGASDVTAFPAPPMPDAGMTEMDGSTPGMDGSTTDRDSGTTIPPDGGTGGNKDASIADNGSPTSPDEGCGCAVAHHGAPGSAFGLLLVGLLLFVRKRR